MKSLVEIRTLGGLSRIVVDQSDDSVLRQKAMSDGVSHEEYEKFMAANKKPDFSEYDTRSTADFFNRPIGIISVLAFDPDDIESQMKEVYNHGPGNIIVIPAKPNFGWVLIESGCRMPEPDSTYLCCTVNRKVMVTARPLDDWLINKYSLTHWAEIVLPETLPV